MINIVKCECLGGACPTQWDLTDDKGNKYYARYRMGVLNIWDNDHMELNFLSVPYGEKYCGVLSFAELKDLATRDFIFNCEEQV